MDPWTVGVFLGVVCLNVADRDSRVEAAGAGAGAGAGKGRGCG